ncbi:MAG: hypothetical protein FWC45_04005 [Treponema sp.]|nr:hypothetical protein [Treponema sp.]
MLEPFLGLLPDLLEGCFYLFGKRLAETDRRLGQGDNDGKYIAVLVVKIPGKPEAIRPDGLFA